MTLSSYIDSMKEGMNKLAIRFKYVESLLSGFAVSDVSWRSTLIQSLPFGSLWEGGPFRHSNNELMIAGTYLVVDGISTSPVTGSMITSRVISTAGLPGHLEIGRHVSKCQRSRV